jgi:hypothetical protein
MIRKIIYIALIGILFASCEEYYTPKLEEVPAMLVVDSHLTNNPNQNFVRLSITKNFYSSETSEPVIGAKVELIQYFGETTQGIEISNGYFTFPVTPIPEKKYQLRISYLKDTYVSDAVIMPPIPTIDTLYTKHVVAKSYRIDAFGTPVLVETPDRQICIDAPILPDLKYYRFGWKAVLLWVYTPPVVFPPPKPSWFGWKTLYQAGQFNMAGPKEFSSSDEIRQHEVLSLSYDSHIYLDSVQQVATGWIVIINQYGIPKASHDFHEMLNKQFSAEGSLFDPVTTQVYGNIHCKTDPTKTVLGFFDLNSYRQYRYYLYLGTGPDNQVNQHRVTNDYNIPDQGYEIGTHPVFWENNY